MGYLLPRGKIVKLTERVCDDCHKLKPIEEFPRRASANNGRLNVCIACDRERATKAYRKRVRRRKMAAFPFLVGR